MSTIKAPYITTTHGMSGFFAVKIWWNPDGHWEPWDTGFGRFPDREQAELEAKGWAEEEGLEYRVGSAPAPDGSFPSRTALNPKAAWPFPPATKEKKP